MQLKLLFAAAAAATLVGCSTTTTMAPIENHARGSESAATTVPIEEGSSTQVPASPYLAKEKAPVSSGRTHVVVAGDTLYNIGVRYGVNPRELAALNGISDPTTISIGTELRIPQTEPAETTVMGETIEMVPAAGGETVTATTTAPAAGAAVEVAKRPETPDEAATREIEAQRAMREAAARGEIQFPWPVPGAVIATYEQTGNMGIDIAGTIGEPIKAVLDGTVQYVGQNVKGYGQFVIVRHNVRLPGKSAMPLVTVYGNTSKILVRINESVRKGQTIALMGDSDSDTGAKMRFEVRQGPPLDPMKYLKPRKEP